MLAEQREKIGRAGLGGKQQTKRFRMQIAGLRRREPLPRKKMLAVTIFSNDRSQTMRKRVGVHGSAALGILNFDALPLRGAKRREARQPFVESGHR